MVKAPNRTYGTSDLPLARAFDVDAQKMEKTFDKLYEDYFVKGQGTVENIPGSISSGRGRKHDPYVLFVLNPKKQAVVRVFAPSPTYYRCAAHGCIRERSPRGRGVFSGFVVIRVESIEKTLEPYPLAPEPCAWGEPQKPRISPHIGSNHSSISSRYRFPFRSVSLPAQDPDAPPLKYRGPPAPLELSPQELEAEEGDFGRVKIVFRGGGCVTSLLSRSLPAASPVLRFIIGFGSCWCGCLWGADPCV